MFTVYFQPSTTTPHQPGMRQLVDAALADQGAEWTGEQAEVALHDGSSLYLLGEDQNEQMLAEYPVLTAAVAEVILSVLRRTQAFLHLAPADDAFFRAPGTVGDLRGPVTFSAAVYDIQDLDHLLDLLKDLPAVVQTTSADTPSDDSPRRQSSNRMSGFLDILFGKKV